MYETLCRNRTPCRQLIYFQGCAYVRQGERKTLPRAAVGVYDLVSLTRTIEKVRIELPEVAETSVGT